MDFKRPTYFFHFEKESIGSIQFDGKIINTKFPITISINLHT